MAKLVRHLTSNEEIVSSNLAEGIILFNIFCMRYFEQLIKIILVFPKGRGSICCKVYFFFVKYHYKNKKPFG